MGTRVVRTFSTSTTRPAKNRPALPVDTHLIAELDIDIVTHLTPAVSPILGWLRSQGQAAMATEMIQALRGLSRVVENRVRTRREAARRGTLPGVVKRPKPGSKTSSVSVVERSETYTDIPRRFSSSSPEGRRRDEPKGDTVIPLGGKNKKYTLTPSEGGKGGGGPGGGGRGGDFPPPTEPMLTEANAEIAVARGMAMLRIPIGPRTGEYRQRALKQAQKRLNEGWTVQQLLDAVRVGVKERGRWNRSLSFLWGQTVLAETLSLQRLPISRLSEEHVDPSGDLENQLTERIAAMRDRGLIRS